MKLGLNLSFATKRWLNPEKLAEMCKRDFGVRYIQFTWDLIDPWWPEAQRDALAQRYQKAFREQGLEITATFGGLASYTYAQLLAPTKEEREISHAFFKRAIDMTAAMGVDVIGTPIGGMTHEDAEDPARRNELYHIALDYLRKLAEYGREKGIKEIQIEATPLATEFPHSPKESLQLMKDLDGTTAIPVKLLIDWGHALYKPLLKEEADMELWLKTCAPYIGAIHIQQTDGMLDRHWDFTKEGIVTPDLIKKATKNAGAENIIQYLEVVTAFEEFDDVVYENMKKSMEFLKDVFKQ
jgi:sugar phosphate isomerase/epimerase